HTHSYEVTDHKDATCTEAGYDEYTCSCGDTYTNPIEALGHTPTGEYQSDDTNHWQVCSVCDSKVNEEAHTAGSLSYIDQQYHGTKCTVCDKVLSQAEHNFDAVWDEDFEEWARVCTDCGIELGSISYDSKYVIVGDFEDASWTLAPDDENLILEYDSRYQNTEHWIRTVTTTEYNRQGYDASFRICVYDEDNTTWTTVADYRNLDVSGSTGVIGSSGAYDYNILLDWSTTYEIEVDCSGATPSIVVTYVSGGYEKEEIDGYAIVGSFDDSSWETYPDLDSVYYLEPNEANHWERTITAGGDQSFSGFRVTEYGTYNTVAGGSNLTSDSTGVSAQAAADNNILTTPGVTYDVVLDIGQTTTIKVTIHAEEEEEEHTYITDLSSIPAAGFGEENTEGKTAPNPKSGEWTRGIFYYWNDQWWCGNNVTVNTAAYDTNTEAYVFSWTGDNATNPFAFQVFYTLPEEAGLEIGTSYSLKISFTADFTGYIEINGTAQYVTEGENTVTIDTLTATNVSDLSIQLGDNLGVAGGAFIQNGTFSITYLAFDYLKADVEEGEVESHSYIVDFASTTLNAETDVVGTIGNHLGEFSYFYNFVSGEASISEEGLTFSYDKDASSAVDPNWSSVTLGYNLPADSGLSETAGAGYQYTIRLTAANDCTLLINEEEFEITGGVEFELYAHQSNYGGAASNVPTLLMYFGSRTNSTIVYPNTINITYLAFDF
ncbi:MAG: hypothetical protein LUD22_01450, partial [Coprobacillus sp.]|nr:hypothetical protein [Coprobacillus sp.]